MNVSANDLECLMRDRFVITDDMTPAIREICEAIVEFAGEAVAAEREACASKAREFGGHYPEGSDGRNTFILLAEWIENRATAQST